MPADAPLRIAMWSGPRNISTAMMRSWGNRQDTAVCDEPFYAWYLVQTGREHPGRETVIAAQSNDWREVARMLTGPVPGGRRVYYQKHMTHHMVGDVGMDWLEDVRSCFLIREPRAMLASLLKVVPDAGLDDTGLPQQVRLFEHVRRTGGSVPPVIDSRDVLVDPRAALGKLCEALGLDFDEAMLAWPAGRRDSDGVWAPWWYGAVEKSTGFAPWQPREVDLPAAAEPLVKECEALYESLYAYKLMGD